MDLQDNGTVFRGTMAGRSRSAMVEESGAQSRGARRQGRRGLWRRRWTWPT